MAKTPTATQHEIIRAAVALAAKSSVDHLLYVGDLPLPEETFRGKPRARKKLVQAVVGISQREVIEAAGIPVLPLPDYDLGRPEKRAACTRKATSWSASWRASPPRCPIRSWW